ncbi:MAG: hypothetical protein Q3959_06355 [Limosilactobacillus sp.]|uniref:hypothetical protein n=1 Tax=Limosilactobacillus sp. TaxID=2773925 RepID=UPI002711568D|nr:hypothetical protein [Limosilactobacillus sp.]
MSNRHEIQQELAQAENRLSDLRNSESGLGVHETQTVTIEPSCGDEMQSLRDECSQLRAILEAMEASED